MGQTYDGGGAAMGNTGTPAEHPASSDEMTAALNAALEAGGLERIMGFMGQMPALTGCGGWPGRPAWVRRACTSPCGPGPARSSTPCSGCSAPWASASGSTASPVQLASKRQPNPSTNLPKGDEHEETVPTPDPGGPLRPGLQRPPGRGFVGGGPDEGAAGLRQGQRLHRGPRVRG